MSKNTAEIRQEFINFFQTKKHQVITSSSLIPKHDPTLLFTNAGMNQFKNVFLGIENRSYQCATTVQRCVRAGGKHNDLENVGYTTYHHTFFEMLGNFSFGAYFKHEAIHLAWELLTSKQWFNLSKEKFLITVYDTDDESYNIWINEIGIRSDRVIKIGNNKNGHYISDNFWQMGDTGPCGPCTEIFYTNNHDIEHVAVNINNYRDHYIEIWNLVFMQFNRQIDGTLLPLPKFAVDTGMGLERITAILQNVTSNYEIDLFKILIESIIQTTNINHFKKESIYIIADHIRSSAFLINDGVLPANDGRGYVLRRIIRRAVRHGNILGIHGNFFYKLVHPLIKAMGGIANNIQKQQSMIEKILFTEEEQFSCTLKHGLTVLNQELNKIRSNILDGNIAFRLYDTYGFPLDLTIDTCREHNISVDVVGFQKAMNIQRECSRKSNIFTFDYNKFLYIDKITTFVGYTKLTCCGNIISILCANCLVESIKENEEGIIILDVTTFYAESGGQIGDQGTIESNSSSFKVIDTKRYGKVIFHIGKVIYGKLNCGMQVITNVNKEQRQRISINHSATHLLHATLRKVFGKHVQQKGSLINQDYLRFDFSYNQSINHDDKCLLENTINKYIRDNYFIKTSIISLEEARKQNITMLFNEKYGDQVRVLYINDISVELCGGTHVTRTGNIGLFYIVSEYSISAGVHRIEAITSHAAINFIQKNKKILYDISKLVNTNYNDLLSKIQDIINHNNKLKKDIYHLKNQQIIEKSILLCSKVHNIHGVKVLISQLQDIELSMLRLIANELKHQLGSAIIVIATVINNKVNVIVVVTKDLVKRIEATSIIHYIAKQIEGKGGGKVDFAQAGGNNVSALTSALTNVNTLLMNQLQ